MESWVWAVLVIAATSTAGVVCWKRCARRVYVIDHVRVELHPACVIEDRVVEVVWRAAISMTNTSRRPRPLPVLAERATVRAGRCIYIANVYLDADANDLNPRDVALAWVEFVLPDSVSPRRIDTSTLPRDVRNRSLHWDLAIQVPRQTCASTTSCA